MSKQITKLILRVLVLLVVLVIADRIIGYGLEYLFYQQKRGDDYTTLYALEEAKDDVLIFGTSRASHHYNAKIFTEETGLSCFNAGRDEMEIPYTKAMLDVILKRYQPKVILLDIGPIELGGDKHILYERIATVLMPFANKHPELDSAIAKAGELEVLKTKVSKIYAYNSKLGSAIQNSYTNLGHTSEMGYEPLYNTIDTAVYKESIWDDINEDKGINDDYEQTLINIIERTKAYNVQLVLAISPFYFKNDFSSNSSYNKIKNIAADYNITLLDYTNHPEYTGRPDLFNDDVHLNDKGAKQYTQNVVMQLIEKGLLRNF